LPWHRLYVMQFEEIIRTLTERDEFALPYWDYTSPASYSIPDEFQSKNRTDSVLSALFMPNRNKDGGSLRSADVNAGEPLNKYAPGRLNFLVPPNLSEPNYSRFCSQLDNQLHNQVHLYTGDQRNMGAIPTAAGDPVFWLHHCNIDRIWAAWNASGGQNPTATNGANWADTSFVFASAEGERVEIAISTISDAAALPYKYDRLPGVRPGATLVSSSSQTNVLLKSVGAGVAAASSSPSQPAAAVALGWAPVKAVLAPTASQNRLSAVASSIQRADAGHLVLLLKDVQAHVDPNTVYRVFLDLPENASDDVQDEHYVGLINFFGTGSGHAAHGGRDFEFDVTDVIRRLGAASTLQSATSITIAPVGAPAASSMPMISWGDRTSAPVVWADDRRRMVAGHDRLPALKEMSPTKRERFGGAQTRSDLSAGQKPRRLTTRRLASSTAQISTVSIRKTPARPPPIEGASCPIKRGIGPNVQVVHSVS
jgi:tyrosinase